MFYRTFGPIYVLKSSVLQHFCRSGPDRPTVFGKSGLSVISTIFLWSTKLNLRMKIIDQCDVMQANYDEADKNVSFECLDIHYLYSSYVLSLLCSTEHKELMCATCNNFLELSPTRHTRYRITADLKVETDIIANIAASLTGWAVKDNECRDLQNWCYCFYRWCQNVFDVTLTDKLVFDFVRHDDPYNFILQYNTFTNSLRVNKFHFNIHSLHLLFTKYNFRI
jgi:hypothetical protein